MSTILGFWDLMERAGYMRDGGPTDGMITSMTQQPQDPGVGRYAFCSTALASQLAIEGLFKSGAAPVLMFCGRNG